MFNPKPVSISKNQQLVSVANDVGESKSKQERVVALSQLWRRQLRKRQIESDKVYASQHWLEMTFAKKVQFSSDIDDRSNASNRVA
ncbi:MAG: hypothetical protein K2X93_12640 [Candidatus Obscuribacterales bacterium]|nr:hypothetical protein [Candidatus Obscuribacterales bacterium]